jgi:hypothetical protein
MLSATSSTASPSRVIGSKTPVHRGRSRACNVHGWSRTVAGCGRVDADYSKRAHRVNRLRLAVVFVNGEYWEEKVDMQLLAKRHRNRSIDPSRDLQPSMGQSSRDHCGNHRGYSHGVPLEVLVRGADELD